VEGSGEGKLSRSGEFAPVPSTNLAQGQNGTKYYGDAGVDEQCLPGIPAFIRWTERWRVTTASLEADRLCCAADLASRRHGTSAQPTQFFCAQRRAGSFPESGWRVTEHLPIGAHGNNES